MGLMQKWHWDLGKKILFLYFLLITTSRKMFAFLDIYGSFDVQPRDIADIIKTSVDVYENMKIQIINNSMA